MKITITSFKRQSSKVREAADRGDIVEIKSENDLEYIFARRPIEPVTSFADLAHLFGVVALDSGSEPARDRIRGRLRKSAAD